MVVVAAAAEECAGGRGRDEAIEMMKLSPSCALPPARLLLMLLLVVAVVAVRGRGGERSSQ